jgi:threonine dehydrogenase-like Zn-dependent dehydrogenase
LSPALFYTTKELSYIFQLNTFIGSLVLVRPLRNLYNSHPLFREDRNVERFDTVIIGAGAAGMFCAAQAGQAGSRVLLIDNGKSRA